MYKELIERLEGEINLGRIKMIERKIYMGRIKMKRNEYGTI